MIYTAEDFYPIASESDREDAALQANEKLRKCKSVWIRIVDGCPSGTTMTIFEPCDEDKKGFDYKRFVQVDE